MPKKTKKIANKPAPYPQSATAEIASRNIFQSLIDPRFVKGDIRVMDKYPNSDGILEITDQLNYPVGKIDIQLKTLPSKYYSSPKFRCPKSFFSYCETTAIPVILVLVDQLNGKVYWRHIDAATLKEVREKIKGNSYLLNVPIENCLDGTQREYIAEWTNRAKEAWQKVWQYDSLASRKRELEEELLKLQRLLHKPVKLSYFALKEIHDFLDEYNYLLDKTFGMVKLALYPDYWKIGMGIIKYGFGDVRFVLYPVEYGKSQQLIKEFDPPYDYIDELAKGNVLVAAGLKDHETFAQYPIPYAYELLEDSVFRIVGKKNFPLPDIRLANEYLISFIDAYHSYLNLKKGQEKYLLKDLKYILYSVLPMYIATNNAFGNNIREYNHNIDSYRHFKIGKEHVRKLDDAIERLNHGTVPAVSVTITSEKFDLYLVQYYIGLMEMKGFDCAERQYKLLQEDVSAYNAATWKTWDKDFLSSNLERFLIRFYQFYSDYTGIYFPDIEDYLRIATSEEITLVNILHFDDALGQTRPHLEIYHLRPDAPQGGRILFYLSKDGNSPINRAAYFLDGETICEIDGSRYRIVKMQSQSLDFMFAESPTYSLIDQILAKKMRDFFKLKKTRLA